MADNLTTLMCRLSWNLGASNSWKPQGLSRFVMGLLYLYSVSYRHFPCSTTKISVLYPTSSMFYHENLCVVSNHFHVLPRKPLCCIQPVPCSTTKISVLYSFRTILGKTANFSLNFIKWLLRNGDAVLSVSLVWNYKLSGKPNSRLKILIMTELIPCL